MKKTLFAILSLVALASLAGTSAAQEPVALRFLCFQDRNECDVYADLLARFSEENPGITVSVDVVAESEIHQRLAAEVEADAPPDFARVSDLDVSEWQTRDLSSLSGMQKAVGVPYLVVFDADGRGSVDGGVYLGFMDSAAVVAPFVNLSLFEQADVALPGEEASWDDWLAALDEVVEATDASYVLSVDNKDHRLVGPAMSLGAQYFDDEGKLTLPDADGLRDFLLILTELMEDGKTPTDTLLGTGKSQEYFVRGETVMYICGSWKVEEVAAQVGDAFEWAIVPNPSGAGGNTGVAQLTGLVAFADTDYPKAVAKIFDYLLEPRVSTEFAVRTLTIPANERLIFVDLKYDTEDPVVAAALNGFAREVPRLQTQAIALDLHPLAPVYYEASNTYLRQYFAGELTLEEALAGVRAQLDEAANE